MKRLFEACFRSLTSIGAIVSWMLCLGSPNVWGLFPHTFVLLSQRLEEFLWHAALNTALLKYLGHTVRAVVMEHHKSVFCLLKETSKFCLRSTLLRYLVFRALTVRWNQASPVKNVKLRSSSPRKNRLQQCVLILRSRSSII